MMGTRELREQRAGLLAQARAITDQAEAEKRELSAEETVNFDRAFDDAQKLLKKIERLEALEAAETEARESAGDPVHRQTAVGQTGSGAGTEQRSTELRAKYPTLTDERIQLELRRERAFPRVLGAFLNNDTRDLAGDEARALQQDLAASGGYLTPPLQFIEGLIQAVDNLVFMRQWATKNGVLNADSLGKVSLDNDPADPTWTGELNFGTADSTMSLGMRELHPHPLAKYIKVSKTLVRKATNIEELVRTRLAYKFGVVEENAYLNGNGSGQPLGVFTASDDGIPTSRDVSTGNTATSIQFDGLFEAKYTLKQQYWARARWLFHQDAVKQIAKLKDGEARYIWTESVRVGEPDRILGIPTYMSQYAPNTFTTTKYVGILGDFSFYYIADALQMVFEVLRELYAATNELAIVGRRESDGMPVLAEAFVRVKLG